MHVGWHGLLLALCVVFLATPPSQAERFKLPGTECGRLPNTYECDDTPVGIGDKVLDDGQGRTPEKCTPGEFCPYGDVTYGFGRNHFAQLGVGDYRDRVLPTPLATAYAKIDLLRSGGAFNIMRWSGQSYLYSWGDDQHGQLGLGEFLNDTMPNRIFSIQRPVIMQLGSEHSLVTLPSSTADFFEYNDFAGRAEDFVHYGSSSQPVAPPEECPRYSGRLCYEPTWGQSQGILLVGFWCYLGTQDLSPCSAAESVTIQGKRWWVSPCADLAKFSLTPDPPDRLQSGAVWRHGRVQVYQSWKMSWFVTIRRSVNQGGDGLVAVLQNHGIGPDNDPLGGVGGDLGLSRSTRTSFTQGMPNSFAIILRTTPGDAALEVRGCYQGPFTTDNSGDNWKCRIAISTWKPESRCDPFQPTTCCTDAQLKDVNTCFVEELDDGGPHEILAIYSPFKLEVFLDDPRKPKIKVDLDIRDHIRSYKCASGPNEGAQCLCNGEPQCGGKRDLSTCGRIHDCITDGTAFVGFTGSTGDSYSVYEVTSWNFINLGQDGGLTAFGSNARVQLGLNDNVDRYLPNLVTSLDGVLIRDVKGGEEHTVALSTLGAVYTWGSNTFGQLGQGDTTARNIPTKVRTLEAIQLAAEAGDACTCLESKSGCAAKPQGEPCRFVPVMVSAGRYHTIVVVERDNGAHEMWGWGDNSYGQLGCIDILGVTECPWFMRAPGTQGNWPDQETLDTKCSGSNPRCMVTPRRLSMFHPFGFQAMTFKPKQIVSGAFHNILITDDCPSCPMPGRCAKEGLSRDNCDCDGGERYRNMAPEAWRTWILDSVSCIAKKGEIYAWGSNLRGQIGNNCSDNVQHGYEHRSPSTRICPDTPILVRLNSPRRIHLFPYFPEEFPYSTPVGVDAPQMAVQPLSVSAGHFHNLLLMSDDTLLAWGSNYFGQLGTGDRMYRAFPIKIPYFADGLVKAPNLAPFDGEGESISGPPQPTFRPQRKVKLASAGRHHSVVVAECRGGGFKDDGSCNCKYGWKGPDCNIQCNGGANFSCSGHGTFDQSNKRGDRKTCAAYLESLWRSKKDDNGGKCVGLKAPGRSDAAGCPGDNNNQGCPTSCYLCDEELYDCENDGSCNCLSDYTGPDCGLQCVPVPGVYNFLQAQGGEYICQCEANWRGTYCNESARSEVELREEAAQAAAQAAQSSPAHRTRPAVYFTFLPLALAAIGIRHRVVGCR